MKEIFNIAVTNIKHSQKRSWLTMIGIFIGIAAVVGLVSLGEGLQQSINEVFEEIGSDKLFVQPDTAFGPGTGEDAVNILTEDDLDVMRATSGVEDVVAMGYRMGKVELGEDLGFYFLLGVDTQDIGGYELYREIMTVDILEGRELRPGDSNAVLVGFDYGREDVFLEPVQIGDRIKINDKKFTVAGRQEALGNAIDDRTITLPMDQYEEVTNSSDQFDWIAIRVSEGANPSEVAERMDRALLDHRDLDEDERDFDVSTPEDLIEQFNTILVVVQVVLTGIAFISLIVGGIGIMNTMFTAVLERTKEIGIMKAIGATPRTIQLIFLMESGLLGLLGGGVGVIAGLSLSIGVEKLAQAALNTDLISAYVSWELVVGALAFSTLVGMFSGYFPARAASKQNAVDSLRYE